MSVKFGTSVTEKLQCNNAKTCIFWKICMHDKEEETIDAEGKEYLIFKHPLCVSCAASSEGIYFQILFWSCSHTYTKTDLYVQQKKWFKYIHKMQFKYKLTFNLLLIYVS